MKQKLILKSRYKVEKEASDLKIYEKFTQLMKTPGAQVMEVNREVMKLFPEVHSPATIWAIRKRVAERLKNKKK